MTDWVGQMTQKTHSWLSLCVDAPWLIDLCDMTDLHMWHDYFVHVTWLTRTCDMTYPYMCVTCLIHTCDMFHSYTWRDWFIHVTYSYVWNYSFIHVTESFTHVTWLMHTRDMTYFHIWHDSSIQVTYLHMWRDSMWHDSCIHSAWRIHTCDLTHPYVRHDSCIHVTRLVCTCAILCKPIVLSHSHQVKKQNRTVGNQREGDAREISLGPKKRKNLFRKLKFSPEKKMHSRKSARRRCVRRLTIGTRMATVWLIVHQKSSTCIEYSITLPEILSRFGKGDLETPGLSVLRAHDLAVQIISLQNFRKIFWYKAIQSFISLYRVLYRLRIFSTKRNRREGHTRAVWHLGQG